MSDRIISIGTYMTAEIFRFLSKSQLYVYEFTLDGDLNYFGNQSKKIFDIINGRLKSNDSENNNNTNAEKVADGTNTSVTNTTDNFHCK